MRYDEWKSERTVNHFQSKENKTGKKNYLFRKYPKSISDMGNPNSMTKVVITDDLRIGIRPPNENNLTMGFYLNTIWPTIGGKMKLFSSRDTIRIPRLLMALGKQSTSFEESQGEIPTRHLLLADTPLKWWSNGNIKEAIRGQTGSPHSSIVGRVELEYRKIIRLK